MNEAEYRESCNRVVRHYQNDIEFDIQMMQEGIKAVFWAQEMGTHAAPLWTLEQLPARGEKRRYLFGEADARDIAGQVGQQIRTASDDAIWHYFNGDEVKEVTRERAQSIVWDYQTRMSNLFDDNGYPH